jgi:hypothetical protein
VISCFEVGARRAHHDCEVGANCVWAAHKLRTRKDEAEEAALRQAHAVVVMRAEAQKVAAAAVSEQGRDCGRIEEALDAH